MRRMFWAIACVAFFALPIQAQERMDVIRIGIIGCDTSHVPAFTNAFNNPKQKELEGFKVVAAFPGGSADIPPSKDRVEGFTKQIREKHNVEIVDSIETLLTKVDVVLLESVDGRPHLAQATPVLKAGKKLFIDKPIAGSLADTLKIFALAKEHKTPVFSSSALRFSPGITKMRTDPKVGRILGAVAFSPCSLEPHHPDLYWYGVHGVETLYTLMGPGCVSVTRTHSKDADEATGLWNDGRIGTFRGTRSGKQDYGAFVFATTYIGPTGGFGGYEPLAVEIGKFFRTGTPPVSAEETIEMFAFMEAADESKRQNGARVKLETVTKAAAR
ncbi:MAG: Gfo/Idh/MocA family oxidoreductase [Gemmataceae bacterium]|nr:Gfo/Idh/MocA family oxidoreductase [Gemmataceae bacterium]